MSKKIRIFLLSCVLVLACCMGMVAGASEDAEAKLIAHNLTITDAGINVNFYVEMQGDVEVTLNGNKVDNYGETERIIVDAKAYDCYKFVQPVVAKKMNEDVSLVIKSGDTNLIDESYSVNDYVAKVQNAGYNYNFEGLVNAMTYYGEFADVYLKYSGKTAAGDDAKTHISTVDSSTLADYKMSVNQENMNDLAQKGLTCKGIQLNLNSEITLRFVFAVEGDVDTAKLVAKSGSTEIPDVLKRVGNNCYIDIEKIGADALNKAYTIEYDDKTILSNCSVLSYAKAVVDAYSENTEKANLVNLSKALYLYNQKANTYVTSQATAVCDIFYNSGFSATPDGNTPVYLTKEGDVTTKADGNTVVTKLSQLNNSRTKGSSIWMQSAYTVAADENVTTGPYVIRRYTGNSGNVLNVAGTATLNTKVDGSLGNFVAKYPGGTETVSFETNGSVVADNSLVNVAAGAIFTINDTSIQNSHVENGEVYVSGTPAAFNITGDAKSGVVTVASGVTGVTINVEGLTAIAEEEQVVLASHAGQSLTGNGDASAITLIDDGDEHFGVVKHNNNVRIASVICVCGDDVTGKDSHSCPWTNNVEGIANVYDIGWQAHTATTGYMPGYNSAGYYYLTNNLKLSSESYMTVTSYLDLNGKTITCSDNSRNIRMNVADIAYSIADSKDGGTIKLSEDYNYPNGRGGVIYYRAKNTFNMYGGTLDMSNTAAAPTNPSSSGDEYALIDITYGGIFAIYGGEIKSAKDGDGLDIRTTGEIIALGGTIYGEVLVRTTNGSVTVGGDAKVGVPMTNESTGYGINAWEASSIVCDNLNKDAKIVLTKKGTLTLSEKEGSDSFVSGFELATGGKDGHYGVVKKSDGTLAFATTICVCGENVSDNHNHTCAWVKSQNKSIADVYSIDWLAYTTSNGQMPCEEGLYYYLAQDITLTQQTDISTTSCLDLNGKTITASTATRNIMIKTDANYSITDSKQGQGMIRFPESETIYGAYGTLINVAAGGQINLYGGTIDMTGVAQAPYQPIDVKGTFNMHGGIIKPVQKATNNPGNSVHLRQDGASDIHPSLNVDGGIIYGKIVLQHASNTLTVADDAVIGRTITINGTTPEFGITAWVTGTSLVSKNVNENAQIVIVSSNVVLSGTGVASAFTVPTGYEVVETDGVLSMVKK